MTDWLGNYCDLSAIDRSRYGGNRDPIDRGYVSPDQYEQSRDYYDHNTV